MTRPATTTAVPASKFHDTQPHSLEAERTVIGAILIDAEKIVDVAPIIAPTDFYDPTYRQIFEAAWQLYHNREPIDFVTVAEKLADNDKVSAIGGSAFLAEIASDVPTASHAQQYANIVREKSLRRQLIAAGKSIASFGSDEAMSANQMLEESEQKLLAVANKSVGDEPVSVADAAAASYEFYAKLHEAEDTSELLGLSFGFPDLDQKLTGLAPGELIVIAGRPAMGKSLLALDIARHIAKDQQKRVAFFSLEMTRQQLIDRLIAGTLGIDVWMLNKGKATEAHLKQMGYLVDEFRAWQLTIDDDPATCYLPTLRSKARRLAMQGGIDLLIVDYLQLIDVADESASENRTQQVSRISRSLKQLAKELHCPVIALSQVSRRCEERTDKKPVMSDLRDSGTIEQDAHTILMLYRESYYNEDCENPDVTDVFIRKNRQGETGRVELRFEKEKIRFGSRA